MDVTGKADPKVVAWVYNSEKEFEEVILKQLVSVLVALEFVKVDPVKLLIFVLLLIQLIDCCIVCSRLCRG